MYVPGYTNIVQRIRTYGSSRRILLTVLVLEIQRRKNIRHDMCAIAVSSAIEPYYGGP